MDYSKLSKEELIALLENRDAELYQTRKERDEALKKLEEVIEKKNVSRAKMFARKSEIRKNTFNEAEETKEKEENGSNKKGRKVGSKNFDYAYLESHVDETIYLKPEQIDESAKYIGEDVSYKISWIPGKYKITKIISKKYVSNDGKIYQVIKDDWMPLKDLIESKEVAPNFDMMLKVFLEDNINEMYVPDDGTDNFLL